MDMRAGTVRERGRTEGKNREIEVVIKEKIGYNCLRRSSTLLTATAVSQRTSKSQMGECKNRILRIVLLTG